MADKPISYGTVYGRDSPRECLRPTNASEREAAEREAQSRRRNNPVEDPALLGFDPYA